MSCSGERYKKWLLHSKTRWPLRENYTDKVQKSWFGDRNINAFHWDIPERISDSILYAQRENNKNYIDYIVSSNLVELAKGEISVFLLNDQGVVLHLSSTPVMGSMLAELGIRLGSILSKEVVGTTAYSLAKAYGITEQTFINETYLKALHPFHMYCTPVRNVQQELYMMTWLDTDDEEVVSVTTTVVKKMASQPSLNLNHIQLLQTVMNNCDSMIFIFDSSGNVKIKNSKAEVHSNNDGVIVNDNVIFNFDELFRLSSTEREVIKKEFRELRYKLEVDYHFSGRELIVYAKLHSEKIESNEWKQKLIGESIGRDSYLDKIIKQRSKTGLRFFISGEVGAGVQYIVWYLSRKMATKKIVNMDCLAGFSNSDNDELTKTQFIDILHKANNHILHIENVELLSYRLQVVLLKLVSSGMLTTVDNQTVPVNIDLICSSSESNWQTTRTHRLLYLMLSTSYISLKPIVSDSEKLYEFILKVVKNINRKENRELTITDRAMDVLLTHSWPGNYLEVFQIIENACLKCNEDTVTEDDIPFRFNELKKYKGMEEVKDAERNAIVSTWKKHNGKLALVSNELGLSRTTLWRKMKKFNLDKNSLSLEKH